VRGDSIVFRDRRLGPLARWLPARAVALRPRLATGVPFERCLPQNYGDRCVEGKKKMGESDGRSASNRKARFEMRCSAD
jgi:hypothetical protein